MLNERFLDPAFNTNKLRQISRISFLLQQTTSAVFILKKENKAAVGFVCLLQEALQC